jgi:hypothetical protein
VHEIAWLSAENVVFSMLVSRCSQQLAFSQPKLKVFCASRSDVKIETTDFESGLTLSQIMGSSNLQQQQTTQQGSTISPASIFFQQTVRSDTLCALQ